MGILSNLLNDPNKLALASQMLLGFGQSALQAGAPPPRGQASPGFFGGLGQAFAGGTSALQQAMLQQELTKTRELQNQLLQQQVEQGQRKASLGSILSSSISPERVDPGVAGPARGAETQRLENIQQPGGMLSTIATNIAGVAPEMAVNLIGQQAQTQAAESRFERQQDFTAGQNRLARAHATDLATRKMEFTRTEGELDRQFKVDLAITKAKIAQQGDAVKQGNTLRDDFLAQSKNFSESRDAMARVEASAKDPSPAGDLALIFNYMKILDPESVVRESEFIVAAKSGSYGDRIQAAVNRVTSGQRLNDDMRRDFADRARRLFEKQREIQGRRVESFTDLAKRQSVNPEDVIVDVVPDRTLTFNPATGRIE